MPDTTPIDLTSHATMRHRPRVSQLGERLTGSEILKIAAEIRALQKSGQQVCNLTVGDFDPKHFPIPQELAAAVVRAVQRGETNYPPSNGVFELREAVRKFYAQQLGIAYPLESILIASGARPAIYGTFRALVDPGESVLYPVPSWNNNHYCTMVGALPVIVPCGPKTRFLPTAAQIEPHLKKVRLVCLNTPSNPSGTAIDPDELAAICALILNENERREAVRERPVYLMFDQIYWPLSFGGTRHTTPPACDQRMARYTIFVDGVSKAFAATGLRVGWAVGPVDVIERMGSFLGHVGAWAPRAEQFGCAEMLGDAAAIQRYHQAFFAAVRARLQKFHDGFQALKAEGLPCDSLPPQGAIYLSANVAPFGRKTRAGHVLGSNEDVRRYLLEAAGVALVPFQAFGVVADDGWFRISVGAIGEDEIAPALRRIAEALRTLS